MMMANVNNLVIFTEARGIGSVNWDQLRRRFALVIWQIKFATAAISIVSNICEGAGMGSDRQFARYLKIARLGSANELQGQLACYRATDLGYIDQDHPVIDQLIILGKRMSCLIKKFQSEAGRKVITQVGSHFPCN